MPLRDATGETAAAMNVSAHSQRVTTGAMLEEFLPLMRETARHVEEDLAAQGRRAPQRS